MKLFLFLLISINVSFSFPAHNQLGLIDSLEEKLVVPLEDSVSYQKDIPFGNVALQFVGGDVLGLGLGLLGAAIGDHSGAGAIAGFTLGVSLGVYLLGSGNFRDGSFFPVLVGTVAGILTSILTVVDSHQSETTAVSILFIPAACGIFAYYMFGHSDIDDTAFLNLKENNLRFSMPSITVDINKFKPGNNNFSLEIFRLAL